MYCEIATTTLRQLVCVCVHFFLHCSEHPRTGSTNSPYSPWHSPSVTKESLIRSYSALVLHLQQFALREFQVMGGEGVRNTQYRLHCQRQHCYISVTGGSYSRVGWRSEDAPRSRLIHEPLSAVLSLRVYFRFLRSPASFFSCRGVEENQGKKWACF